LSVRALLRRGSRAHKKLAVWARQMILRLKRLPTFSDALAAVRRQLWHEVGFHTSAFRDRQRKSRLGIVRTPDGCTLLCRLKSRALVLVEKGRDFIS
jgi:hypothetical protein